MDQESEGTNLVIFVVGGVVLLLLLLGGGAAFFLMARSEARDEEAIMEAAEEHHKVAPVMEGPEQPVEKVQRNEPGAIVVPPEKRPGEAIPKGKNQQPAVSSPAPRK